MNTRTTTWEEASRPLWAAGGLLLRPLHAALFFPSALYLATLAVFLFRPPDLYLYYADRIVFCALVFCVALRALALRERLPFIARLSLPMLGLIGLAVVRALREPFDAQTWSLIAGKFIVPFTLFHLAILVFRSAPARAHFRIFVMLTLAYLIFTAVAFLIGARALIFPGFILDESLGFHFDRARGPFLQAVANGLSLNLLGLLAVAFAGRQRKLVLLLWLVLPLAILATMTRAVWISFAVSAVALAFRLGERRLRRACVGLVFAGLAISLVAGLGSNSLRNALQDRSQERGPLRARMAVYNAGWSMFRERPLVGWPASGMYAELAHRMEGYHLRSFYVHNTYLSMLIEFGIPGLALYAILFFHLFRLARDGPAGGEYESLRKIWPILLGVFLFNAFFVDMVYQFVTGLMFTVAGILCASAQEGAR
ncbi:MAG: O-antigen ligase family protein [Terriglobales bacterium]